MTWNPVTGCTKVSQGCKHCYAERMAKRLTAMGAERYRNGFSVTLHPDLVDIPRGWRLPRVVFVNSMSDLFHENIPTDLIRSVFSTMLKAHWHTFQILTKRADRLLELSSQLPWPKNVWMGVSVETPVYFSRIRALRRVPAAVRFLSLEPLLDGLPRLPLAGIDWVIVGGESGPKSRPMSEGWVKAIRTQCTKREVPFFFKQWGGTNKKTSGRSLEGRTYDEVPIPVLRQKKKPDGTPAISKEPRRVTLVQEILPP